MPYNIYFISTPKCNITCRHCCYSANPARKTPDTERTKRVIAALPEDIYKFEYSGGEPLFDETHTMAVLTAIKKRLDQGTLNIGSFVIYTNGLIFHKAENGEIEQSLRSLIHFGINEIWLTGLTGYHLEQIFPELNIEELSVRQLNELRNKYIKSIADKFLGLGIPYSSYKGSNQANKNGPLSDTRLHLATKGLPEFFRDIVPRGAASTRVEGDLLRRTCGITPFGTFLPELAINYKGLVFICCSGGLPIGNILDAPLEVLLERFLEKHFPDDPRETIYGVERRKPRMYKELPCHHCRDFEPKAVLG